MTGTANRPIGVGVIGMGFMGRTHARAYQSLWPRCRLIATADRSPPVAGVGGNIGGDGAPLDLSRVEHHADAAALLSDERIDLVSVCTPTDTHVDLALAALDAGKHVLVEKPVSANTAGVERLAGRARLARTLCVPAMCLRFWPEWAMLAAAIADRRLGALRSLTIERLGPPPDWNDAFYFDERRSGGMITDLHIHDTDFVAHALGVPSAVATTGHARHLTSAYLLHGRDAAAHVTAEASWDLPATAPFRMAFRAVFEKGMLEHDSRRGAGVEVHSGGAMGRQALAEGSPADGYEGQIRALLDAIERGGEAPVSMDDALRVARVLDAERSSLALGGALVPVEHEPRA